MALSFHGCAMSEAPPYYNKMADALLLNKTGCAMPAATLVANFTVSSDLHTTEKLMVTTTMLMTILGGVLFARCLLARFSGRHRGHSTVTRIFFRASFTLFLPFMSYTFSQARSKGAPARPNLILLWMLLVELLRKKVYAMVAPEGAAAFAHGVGRYSFFDAVEQAARVGCIGYLIYSYVHGSAIKSFFIILWVLSVIKLCKRALCIELAKRSFDLAKNASLVSGYMAHLTRLDELLPVGGNADNGGRSNILSRCNYVVMGESLVNRQETPLGFRFPELDGIITGQLQQRHQHDGQEAETIKLVRVCMIWHLAESDLVFRYNERHKHKLQEACLGLALFKLLRRKIEHQPMAEAGTAQALAFVWWGLLEELGAERAFEVVEQELTFLVEYYQAIIPLALPKPELFLANFAFSILFLLVYIISVMLVTGNGHIFHVLASLFRGLVGLSMDMVLRYRCFVHLQSFLWGMVLSSSVLIVTFLLTAIFIVIEIYEFVQYMLSDWHLVSLVCKYARNPALHVQRAVKFGLRIRAGSHRVKVHQFTLLKLHQLHPRRIWLLLSRLLKRRLVGLPDATVTAEAKQAIVKVLKDARDRIAGGRHQGRSFSNGREALQRCRNGAFRHLEWACDESGGATTVVLVWHLATALLDDRRKHPLSPAGKAAVMLSRYCAYLVAYEPGLLPDDWAWTEKIYRDITAKLDAFFRSCCTTTGRSERLMAMVFDRDAGDDAKPLEKGVMLAKELESAAGSDTTCNEHRDAVWEMLLELWAELLVFAATAPSGRGTRTGTSKRRGVCHPYLGYTHPRRYPPPPP